MPDVDLGKTIEKVLSKVKKEKEEQAVEKEPSVATAPPSSPPPTTTQKFYLKALPLRAVEDIDLFKREVNSGNILIVKVSPLAKKSIEDVQRAVSELCEFASSMGGDIARLGEERIVITPSFVKIWRERAETSETEPTVA